MTVNTTQDAFARLPEELRIQIIKLSPDPWSLRNLTHASPAMYRVLDRYPLEILDAVLDRGIPVLTRRLMGAVLETRLGRFPASLSEAKRVAGTGETVDMDEVRGSGVNEAAAAVRSLLAVAENIHAWSHACLDYYIERSMKLRPLTIISNGTGRTYQQIFETAESHDNFLPQETGPPSWVEEQRMIKAFWRLQFLLELQDAGNKGRLGDHWPGHEVETLSQSSPGDFYDVYSFEQEQILTACEFYGAVTSGTITTVETVRDNTSGLPMLRRMKEAAPRPPCAEPLFFELNTDYFQQGTEYADRGPNSHHFLHVMSIRHPDAPSYMLGIPFQPYRKHGFAIWDGRRMADLGMRRANKRGVLSNYLGDSFRWWSILTEEEMRQRSENRL